MTSAPDPAEIASLWHRLDTSPSTARTRAIDDVIDLLDAGEVSVAERDERGSWLTNLWVKQALDVYFRTEAPRVMSEGMTARDKYDLKRDPHAWPFRLTPPGAIRRGSYVGEGAIVLAGFVNLGARVGPFSLVDAWASVGTCAQVGAGVTLMPGSVVVGTLHPLEADPTIVEDGCYVGSNAVVGAGVVVRERAVLAAGLVLSRATPVADATGSGVELHPGLIPEAAVVVPGSIPGTADGRVSLTSAVILGWRADGERASEALHRCMAAAFPA